jgi:hypothetical protein
LIFSLANVFSRKRSKKQAEERVTQTFREAEPRGFGGEPQRNPLRRRLYIQSIRLIKFFFFQKKKQKALFRFAEGPKKLV